MSAPLISVIMTAYNSEPYIGAAIDSLLAQSLGDFELLVIDDHSSDATGRIMAEAAARDPRIRLVSSPQKGRVSALNLLVAQARAPWLAVMDSDDIAMPERFEKQMAFLESHPDHGVVGSDTHVIDTQGRLMAIPVAGRPCSHDELVAHLEDGVNLHHPSVIASTELVRAAGGYRAPFRFAQDYDLFLRLSTRTRMANLPEALVSYRRHPGQVSTQHVIAQSLSAVVAWLSHTARMEGRPDPVDGLEALPPLGSLDTLFVKQGCDAYARRRIVERILYAPDLLANEAFPILTGHIREAGARPELWRAAARLLRAGHPRRAAQLGLVLAAA